MRTLVELWIATLLTCAVLEVSCAPGLPLIDQEGIRRAIRLDESAYKYVEAGTPASAFMRAAYCSDRGVARRQHLPLPEASVIDCDGP